MIESFAFSKLFGFEKIKTIQIVFFQKVQGDHWQIPEVFFVQTLLAGGGRGCGDYEVLVQGQFWGVE